MTYSIFGTTQNAVAPIAVTVVSHLKTTVMQKGSYANAILIIFP